MKLLPASFAGPTSRSTADSFGSRRALPARKLSPTDLEGFAIVTWTARIRTGNAATTLASRLFLAAAWAAVGGAVGCCLQIAIVPIVDGGGTTGGGVDGGPDAGDGGDAGAVLDGGTCRIGDAGPIPAGTWLDTFYGSCTICDPSLNADGWTVLDGGQICQGFASVQPYGPLVVPFVAVCRDDRPPFRDCAGGTAGSTCNEVDGFGCGGGFCNDAGWCEVDQNLGWFASCGYSNPPNPCAHGPCCIDAGFEGIPDGGGWCCGLVDGGVNTCLPSGSVCYDNSNCCESLTCTGRGAVYGSDAGYGFCR